MNYLPIRMTCIARPLRASTLLMLALFISFAGAAQQVSRQFPPGSLQRMEDLPAGRLRSELDRLPEGARTRGFQWLRSFHFTTQDLESLHADTNGGILYACKAELAETTTLTDAPVVAQASVAVNPFPASLIYHSRPGAPNVIYLNFCGETVSNTDWNSTVSRTEIPAVAFSLDGDLTSFSDAEQLAIKRVWERVAEDYAPFNVDVTTERPATFGARTAHALITRTTDANGQPNPYYDSGGVAYVNVFGTTSYSRYRPAWIYYNNLANSEANIAEAASHEIGHNMGLSHDGKTDGTEYYGGHGSGDVSWGPLMGTGYGRSVSQWSKGDYYLANNTQDDLAIIAGKLTYRSDDVGNTLATATPLALTGTNILVTTPETDPTNTNTSNKGVLERNTDVDVFSFVTGNGPVNIAVRPWMSPANTRGGNLDLLVSLYNEAGVLLLTNNPESLTTALIQTNLSEGRYYLYVANTGVYDPFQSAPAGYTSYGSIGQYFISGYVTPANVYVPPPIAELRATDMTQARGPYLFSVAYSDNAGIAVATIDGNDLRVTGPNGFDAAAQFVSIDVASDGSPRLATYSVQPPGGTWTPQANGTYSVWMNTNQVGDVEGAWVAAGQLGTFNVSVPVVVYSAYMDSDPGWTLEAPWEYGTPAYGNGSGPTAGYTGTKIIALNLSGTYTNDQPVKYATTPVINCTGASSLTLRFKRWLQTRTQDPVAVQVSTTPDVWTDLWSTSSPISDTSWQDVQYALPSAAAGNPSVRLRWSLASNKAQNGIGWNIDDVEILAGGNVDSTPPTAALSVANLTTGGSPSHPCSVTYTDDSGVRLSSLGADLVVIGPSGYSNLVEFAGADLPADGSPLTATYSIPAPGGSWDIADNGTYAITLLENEVADIYNNTTGRTNLGTFTVSITPSVPSVELIVEDNNPGWGTVNISSNIYPSGTSVELIATPNTYYAFGNWSGDITSTNNPLSLVIHTNTRVQANFYEVLTAGTGTPKWWLASLGYTNDFETAADSIGVNGIPLWQSYVAGLDPMDPNSRFEVAGSSDSTPNSGFVLRWKTVPGRVYTLWHSSEPGAPFQTVPGAIQLPAEVQSYTNNLPASAAQGFYRLEVQKP